MNQTRLHVRVGWDSGPYLDVEVLPRVGPELCPHCGLPAEDDSFSGVCRLCTATRLVEYEVARLGYCIDGAGI